MPNEYIGWLSPQPQEPHMLPIPEKTILVFTSGKYSAYETHGVFRTLRELNPLDLRNDYLRIYPKQSEECEFLAEQFIAWLIREGCLEIIDSFEWHVNDWESPAEFKVEKFEAIEV
jgi:hypothetical protein